MSEVKISMGLTVNTGNYNNFKPEISITVDTDKDVTEQINRAITASREVTAAVVSEMEFLLDKEGMKDYESSVAGIRKSFLALASRVDTLERELVLTTKLRS